MVNAVLYSDQVIPANGKVDAELLMLMAPRGDRIGYVPSGADHGGRFLAQKTEYYSRLGLQLVAPLDPGGEPDPAQLETLLSCDAIHLSGGHTGGFLVRLQQWGMFDALREWAMRGGLLVGTSAGAILMTPTIAVDALFSGKDPQDVEHGTALGLLPFEFFPHLQADIGYLEALRSYSLASDHPIVACVDGDGVVVADGLVKGVGNPLRIVRGAVEPMETTSISQMRVPSA